MARNTNLLAMALAGQDRRGGGGLEARDLTNVLPVDSVAPQIWSTGHGITEALRVSLPSLFDALKNNREKGKRRKQAETIGLNPASDAKKLGEVLSGKKPAPVSSGDTSQPRGIRNNNPGNIEYGDFAQSKGATGSDGRFAQFETPEQGVSAMRDLLGSYQRRGLNTVEQMINRWAPPGENDSGAYAARVAAAVGVEPNQPIDINDPAVSARMMQAMVQHENGQMPYGEEMFGAPQPQPAGGPPQPQMMAQGPETAQQPSPGYGAPQGQQMAPEPQDEVNGLLTGVSPQEQAILFEAIEAGEVSALDVIQQLRERQAAAQKANQPDYAYEKMDDGTLLRFDKRDGQATPIYQSGPKPTDDMREYQFGQQDPAFTEHQIKMRQAGAARTMGAPPPGWQIQYDAQNNPTGMVAIPGGPADQEAQAARQKAESRQASVDRSSAIVQDEIRRAVDLAKKDTTTGIVGTVLRNIPETDAHNLVKIVDTIKANVGFDRLQQMREASPTGGALGPVSDFENRMLQSVLGSLETSQGQEQLLYNFSRLNETYLDVIHGPGNRPEQGQPSQGQGGGPQPGQVEDGYRFHGGDPADPANWERVQ